MPGTLMEMISFLESKNIDVQPVQEKGKYRFIMWRNGEIFKIGSKRYINLSQGEWEVYSSICQILRMP